MKKITLLVLSLILIVSTAFSQSFIGSTKKEIIKDLKDRSLKIENPVKDKESGLSSITVRFQESSMIFSFTKEDICYFYVKIERYSDDFHADTEKYFDDRYKRAINDKTDIWKEVLGDTFVYRWLICNTNTGIQYTLYLTKEDYNQNQYLYLKELLEAK